MEFCFGPAFDDKIASGWSKHLLRRATLDVLPEKIRLRRKKLGFPGNYAGWLGGLREDTGLDFVRDLMLERRSLERGWVSARWVQERLGRSRHRAHQWISQRTEQTWRMLTAELWARQFLDNDRSSRPKSTSRTLQARPAVDQTEHTDPAIPSATTG